MLSRRARLDLRFCFDGDKTRFEMLKGGPAVAAGPHRGQAKGPKSHTSQVASARKGPKGKAE